MAQKPRIFRVFVSSTFSDMVMERNALQEHVYPRLRELCAKHGVRFQAIDLRWGISQEAGLNQRATDVCLNEIARCQRVTKRPNFLLLMGDRYGWQPLPDDIPSDEWDTLFPRMDEVERAEMQKWYWQDDNAVPPVYILQPRQNEFVNQNIWNGVETRLRLILLKALQGLNWSREQRMKYESSVTEQEIEAGIFNYPHAQEAAFCFFRKIEGLPEDAKDFTDTNPEAQARLLDLKQRLEEYLPQNIHSYTAQWIGAGISFDITAFCEVVYQSLAQAIEAEVSIFTEISPLELENETHKTFLEDRIRHFVGRADVLERVSQYIQSIDNKPLVLYGQSGIGKSTVMAKAIQAYPKALYRFIGISPATSDIRSLLVNLYGAMQTRYGFETNIPQDYEGLIKTFPDFLAYATPYEPLIIFLDALDQLATSNNPSNLRWLPRELPANVKLVVSVIPSLHLDALKKRLSIENLFEILPMKASDAETLLADLLKAAKRTLTIAQKREVLNKFGLNRLPLYLKLAFEEAKLWHSYTADFTLLPDVPSFLKDNLFARLSDKAEHGEMLVSRSLAYLQASRNGLLEEEILEILPLDEAFWADFEARTYEVQRSALQFVKQLPIAVWSRLYFDLEPYLVERGEYGFALLSFYHRQFSETVDAVYLAPERESRHTILANYFKAQETYTARKVTEQAYHQAKANLHDDYVGTLTDFLYLHAYLDFSAVEALIEDCRLMDDDAIQLISSALEMSGHILNQDTSQLAFQVYGRLLGHKEANAEIAAFLEQIQQHVENLPSPYLTPIHPTMQQSGRALIRRLVGHESSVTAVAMKGEIVVSASHDKNLIVWNWQTGQLIRKLEGHSDIISALALQGEIVISASDDKNLIVWNWQSGQLIRKLEGHSDSIRGVAILGEIVISASNDKSLNVWNWQTGQLIRRLEGHSDTVAAVAIQAEIAISASHDNSLIVWNWQTGQLIHRLEGHSDFVTAVAIQDEIAISGSHDNSLIVWNWRTGQPIGKLEGHNRWVSAVAIQAAIAISGSTDRSLIVWNWQSGQFISRLEGHSDFVAAVAVQDNVVISASVDMSLIVWDWQTGQPIPKHEGHNGRVSAIAIQDDVAISASWDHNLIVWNWQTGLLIRKFEAHRDIVNAVAIQDEFAISASGSIFGINNECLIVWNWQTGQLVHKLEVHSRRVSDIAIQDNFASTVTDSIFGSEDNSLIIWNWRTGQLIRKLEDNDIRITAVAIQDDFTISASDDYSLKVWNWRNGEFIHKLEAHSESITAVIMRGEIAISASNDKNLIVWNWQTGQLIHRLEGHSSWVNAVALQGDFAISASHDNSLIVWNWQSGKILFKIPMDAPLSASGIGKGVIAIGDSIGTVHFFCANAALRRLFEWE